MFINANPRAVSNGFETFVPVQITESLHQRLVEMTNNDINAWSVFRPVAPSMNHNWQPNIDEFESNENFPVRRSWASNVIKADSSKAQSLHGGYFSDGTSVTDTQSAYLPKTTVYTTPLQGQHQLQKASVPHQIYHDPMQDIDFVQKSSPMLGAPYLQWGTGQGRGSFAEFSSSRCGLKDLSCQSSNESEGCATATAPSIAQTQSYIQASSMPNECMDLKSYNGTVYGTIPSNNSSVNQQPSLPREEQTPVGNMMKHTWCPQVSSNSNSQYQSTYGLFSPNDGLPAYETGQRNEGFGNVWNSANSSTTWASQAAAAEGTISPKLLTLDVPSVALSASGSSQGTVISESDTTSVPSTTEDASDLSGPEILTVVEQPVPIRPPRQALPDCLSTHRAVPTLPSSSSRTTKKQSMRDKTSRQSEKKGGHPRGPRKRSEPVSPKSLPPPAPKRIEPKPFQLTAAEQATHHRDAKDDFLVRSKLAGMSYKDIRAKGEFTEAESTLRGRFRTLTKHKNARVRKPEWTENDVSTLHSDILMLLTSTKVKLLRKAVRKLTDGSDLTKGRIPWKKVGDYIGA